MSNQETKNMQSSSMFHAPNYNGPYERKILTPTLPKEENKDKTKQRIVTVVNVHRPKA